jgi:hypothetical protein
MVPMSHGTADRPRTFSSPAPARPRRCPGRGGCALGQERPHPVLDLRVVPEEDVAAAVEPHERAARDVRRRVEAPGGAGGRITHPGRAVPGAVGVREPPDPAAAPEGSGFVAAPAPFPLLWRRRLRGPLPFRSGPRRGQQPVERGGADAQAPRRLALAQRAGGDRRRDGGELPGHGGARGGGGPADPRPLALRVGQALLDPLADQPPLVMPRARLCRPEAARA